MITIVAGGNETLIFCDHDDERAPGVLRELGKEIIEMADDEERFDNAGDLDCQPGYGEEYSECIESEYDKRMYQEDLHLDGRPQYMRLLRFEGSFEDARHAMMNGLAVRRKTWDVNEWLEVMDVMGVHDHVHIEDVLIKKYVDETYDCFFLTEEDRWRSNDWGIVGALRYRLELEEHKYREDIVTDDEKRILGNFIKSRKFFEKYILKRGTNVLFSTPDLQKLFEEICHVYSSSEAQEIAYEADNISDPDLWADCVMASDIKITEDRKE